MPTAISGAHAAPFGRHSPAHQPSVGAPYPPPAYTPWPDDHDVAVHSGPRFFGPAARPLFGWYHAPAGRARGEAVVLCPSLGPEYMVGHRMVRTLAERLSADGFAVLRFDWPGTGDSAGDAGDPDCPTAALADWYAALDHAVGRARAWSGAARVTVVGLRAGAALAAAALATGPALGVTRLVLWWPPSSGRQFLREQRARHAMAGLDHDGYAPPDGDTALAEGSVEFDGFVFGPRLAHELGALSFAAMEGAPPVADALVLAPDQGAGGPAAGALAASGIRVETRRVPGHDVMRESALKAVLPDAALHEIAGWLAERADAASPAPDVIGVRVTDLAGSDEISGATTAAIDGAREECVRFGDDARVAGVLTTPAAAPDPAARPHPPVLLLHTGANHRVGPNRMWPVWARRWARDGVTTLRFDPAGLGDTPALPGTAGDLLEAYTDGRAAEVAAAAAYLCERTGADRVVLVGICSGAYYAVRAAAAGLPVARVIAANPQLYAGHEALNRSAVEGHRAPTQLGNAARDPERWGRLLRGETNARKVANMVAAGVGYAARAAVAAAAQEVRVLTAVRAADRGAGSGPLADLWRLGAARVPICLVFAREDEGWAYLRVQARAAWRAFRRRHHVRLHVLDAAEHTFVRAWMQRQLYALVTAELREP